MQPRGRGYKTDDITKQSFEQFTERVSWAFNNISIEEVDKPILSCTSLQRLQNKILTRGHD